MTEERLHMNNVSKVFPGVIALDHVSLKLKCGEILSICGENGAGKSTLMKILSGTYPYGTYQGEVILDGKEIRMHSVIDAGKYGIGIIPQELNIQMDMTITENIMLGHWPHLSNGLINWKLMHQTAVKALDALNVKIDPDVRMRSLNASMQQLVCIAKTLSENPRILILDEPTAALTPDETENLMRILNKLKKNGISCIYISHKLEELFKVSDRIVVMRNGKVVSNYERADVKPEIIIRDMIGREIDKYYPMSNKMYGNECLRIENLTVRHPSAPSKYIVDHVNFSVHKGEILGLTGLVGSGRSEMLRAIYGALPKEEGNVFVDGIEKKIHSPREAIQAGIFMVSEDRKCDGYIPMMSIRENMTLSILKKISCHSFIDNQKELETVRYFFDYLSIRAPGYETRIINLSGGNQQKVILSRALATDAKVLFLDEPTRGIDVGAKAEIYKIINTLAEKGMSLVIISSEMPELLSLCDRFIVLKDSKIVGEFSKSEVTENMLYQKAALG